MKIMLNIMSALLFSNCIKQKDNNISIDNSYQNQITSEMSIGKEGNKPTPGIENKHPDKNDISNIIKYLPANYSMKGDVDYTKYLQQAFNENKEIIMPNFPIAVSYTGITVPSDRIITFQKNSSLIVLPNDQPKYQALLVSNVKNVKIINPNLVGERDQHMNSNGEWGMGINIISSNDVNVINPNIKNFWGDGIYIGRSGKQQSYCNRVRISGGVLDNNRRNGISVISGKDIIIENMTIKNTNGTNPMAGIDLEPNLNDEYLYNINLNNIKTINNKVDGIKVVFHKFTNKNNVLVNIDNHIDEGSQNPLTLVGVDNVNTGDFTGTLNYTNSKWNNAKSNIRVQRSLSPNLKLNIKQVDVNGKMMNKSVK
ncbi:MAG: hypothetical protein MUW56_05075 [Chryseobacterium sp.]|uniref:hypothetical protein n=1 Tax=Chryseobacterium sp. TaxID=1871047 RepID=UPI0025C6A7F7|nr:hypothetical protein [Chryseobacterium sp.]MCJ7933009.1 hypothetical protein [Chryseobacterium sp.]